MIGIGSLLLGIPLMFWWRAVNPAFFRRRAEAATTIDGLLPDPDRITDTDELSLTAGTGDARTLADVRR